MNRDTYEKLRKMRLPEMASQYRKHAESPELYATMTFDEEFGLLVDAEFDARTNNKIKRLLKNSSIPDTTAHIGGIEFLPERHLNQDLFNTLQTNDYISNGLNIMLIGATGSGKTCITIAEECSYFVDHLIGQFESNSNYVLSQEFVFLIESFFEDSDIRWDYSELLKRTDNNPESC